MTSPISNCLFGKDFVVTSGSRNGILPLPTMALKPSTSSGETRSSDLVLTDINMPAMDGLTLLGKLPAPNSVLKAVVVTAYGDMGNIRTAMNRTVQRALDSLAAAGKVQSFGRGRAVVG